MLFANLRDLKLLRYRLGDRFAFGAILYTGSNTVPFGDRLAAVPLCGLWSAQDGRLSGDGTPQPTA